MMNYYREKRFLIPLSLIVFIFILGAIFSSMLFVKSKRIKFQFNEEVNNLEMLLFASSDVFSHTKVKELKEYKEDLVSQLKEIVEHVNKEGDLEEIFSDCKSPLDFRRILAKTKKRFKVADIGFSEYDVKVPISSEMPKLVHQLAFITKLMEFAEVARLAGMPDVLRLPEKEIKSDHKVLFKEYPCLLSFRCDTRHLVSFLYNIASASDLFIVRGMNVVSQKDKLLDVVLKVSYVKTV